MRIEVTSYDRKTDCRDSCSKIRLTARTPLEGEALAALYQALVSEAIDELDLRRWCRARLKKAAQHAGEGSDEK
jgi:hypothetical protein